MIILDGWQVIQSKDHGCDSVFKAILQCVEKFQFINTKTWQVEVVKPITEKSRNDLNKVREQVSDDIIFLSKLKGTAKAEERKILSNHYQKIELYRYIKPEK